MSEEGGREEGEKREDGMGRGLPSPGMKMMVCG